MEISPVKRGSKPRIGIKNTNDKDLTTIPVKSAVEKRLQEALVAKTAEANFFRGRVIQLQSAMVLQRVYCGRIRRQLYAKERKAERNGKKGRKDKIEGDGLGRLLTDDAFFEVVVAHEAAIEAEQREKEARINNKARHEAEVAEWAENVKQRKVRNKERENQFETALQQWNAAKAVAKAARIKIKDWEVDHPKPKKRDPEYAPEPAIPKPKLKDIVDAEAENDRGSDDDPDSWTDDEDEPEY
ncbi:hypothetical protein GALMADRAFT_218923 [Galerina marginata CBS 339.88]|uniref:Uncharacterized protein n=1 Tax=Galerina marginata (strain CBS 339.88) TaxID=685588 RepID=A0A067U0N4_GALM3|nr:hypothetical protein GALMADRAFT_218923 [Galerina marginata CBS 339.88]